MVEKKSGSLVGECNNVNNVNSGISEKSINNQEVHNDTLLDIIEKTRTIINSVHDGIIIYDKDFRYREWNPFMEKLSGFKREDVIGKYPTEIFPFLVESGVINKLEKVLSGGQEIIQEFPLTLLNKKSSGTILDTSKPLLDYKGNIIGILAIIKDLTSIKQDELELLKLNRTLKMLTGCSQILLQVKSEDELLNKICEKITKLGGYIMSWVGYIDDKNSSKKIIIKAQSGFEEGYLYSINITFDKNDVNGQGPAGIAIREGEPIAVCHIHNESNYIQWGDVNIKGLHCSSMALPLKGTENETIGVLMVYSNESDAFKNEDFKLLTELSYDLSTGIQFFRNKEEKNKIAELLKQSELNLQIRQRIDSLGTLAGGICHDFNNLLMGIMGNLELLNLDKNISSKNKEYIKNALKTCIRAADLIKQIQQLSINNFSEKKSIDIHKIIIEVFDLLNLDKKISSKIVNRIIDFNANEFYVKGNGSELHQIFLNLGINSLQAIEEDKGKKERYFIKISANNFINNSNDISDIPKGDYVHITFQDNGKGMSEEIINKAFDPLFTTRERSSQKGQGMGLSMVYNIIFKSHKGYISIESREGIGTTFNIYLPRALSSEEVKPKIEKERKTSTLNETILVIDDEEIIRKLLETMLKELTYNVIIAIDGVDGLEKYKENKDLIDLVILDLLMPNMSGQEVLEKMLNIKRDVKVIISSGFIDDDPKNGILSKAKGFINKPYSFTKLEEEVRKVLDNK